MAIEGTYGVILVCSVWMVAHGAMQDLTHLYDDNIIKWPGHKPWVYHLNRGYIDLPNDEKVWLESNAIDTAEHMGTHIDAPAHLYKGGDRLDKITLDKLIGPMAVIDATTKSEKFVDYMLTVGDVMEYEDTYGRIPDGAAVFMNNGYDKYWYQHNKTAFLGSDSEDIFSLHYPGFHPDTVEWLVENRDIRGVGIDVVSFDAGSSEEFGAHVNLFSHGRWGLENLANLGKVPPAGATVHVMPMNIYGGSGGPSRVVAFWDTEGASDATITRASITALLISIAVYLFAIALH